MPVMSMKSVPVKLFLYGSGTLWSISKMLMRCAGNSCERIVVTQVVQKLNAILILNQNLLDKLFKFVNI